ncbi:MAG: hypothetical protein A3F12_06720 [Gammaproteobacteria bacterium RIFCSPHIGHO2_12_FULL_38_14]|nr:MAG: hypothetical protein A3F12_06720 [Gammaproteobacteria bacterium RIFCSPHIGHO2_12_FULL_38_14]
MNKMFYIFFAILLIIFAPITKASEDVWLRSQPGFFRFNFEEVSIPNNNSKMGLLGLNYFIHVTPIFYGGIGTYGAVTGTQGGFFIFGAGVGAQQTLYKHWVADANFFLGGGGGKSSLVGGGLMLRPAIGLYYTWEKARLGLQYSYIYFPNGEIRSQQIGLGLDLFADFYYVPATEASINHLDSSHIKLPIDQYLSFDRNDFALFLQAYQQKAGTRNSDGQVQDGTIQLIGAEWDHFLTDRFFWWLKTSGAFNGIPNGYMDILGGFGYQMPLISNILFLVPQLGIGAGGGGMVDSGGGMLINPLLGIEWPLFSRFSVRLSGGYLSAVKGDFKAYVYSGELLYHLDFATAEKTPTIDLGFFDLHRWQIQFFNQTYFTPQRSQSSLNSSIEMFALQLDQLISEHFHFSYQAAGAYSGYRAGGYATGMIGPGVQSTPFYHDRMRVIAELLIGAGGGGGLALNGGALIEPVIGLQYLFTPAIGVQASFSQVKALRDDLNTPVLNIGFTIRFDTLSHT